MNLLSVTLRMTSNTTLLLCMCSVLWQNSGDGGCTPLGHASALLFAFALERVLTSEGKG